MNDRRRDNPVDEAGRIHRLAGLRRYEPKSTDWHWLDALRPSDLDPDFMGAVEERVEDQERPRLENLCD
jgi:hypothetical protein